MKTANMMAAARDGNLAPLEWLLSKVKFPRGTCSVALANAACAGHVACVRALLPYADAKAGKSRALREAADNGHDGCVAVLLPVSSITAALRTCAPGGCDLLLTHLPARRASRFLAANPSMVLPRTRSWLAAQDASSALRRTPPKHESGRQRRRA